MYFYSIRHFKPTGSYRDSIIFLVDCTKSMFAKQDEKDETLFQECMSAILSVYQSKIYSSDKDFLGLVFFGTEKNNTGDDFLHMNMIQVILRAFLIGLFIRYNKIKILGFRSAKC